MWVSFDSLSDYFRACVVKTEEWNLTKRLLTYEEFDFPVPPKTQNFTLNLQISQIWFMVIAELHSCRNFRLPISALAIVMIVARKNFNSKFTAKMIF